MPQHPLDYETPDKNKRPPYRDAIQFAAVLQLLVLGVLSTVLDGGHLARIGVCATIGFWAGTLMILSRRPPTARPIDILYIRFGFLAMLAVAAAIAALMGRM